MRRFFTIAGTDAFSTTYIYDGMRVIQDRGAIPVAYTRGNDLSGSLEGAGGIGGLLARSHGYNYQTGNWSTHNFYHADGGGNITYLVNSSQTLAASYKYDAYGNLVSQSGALAGVNGYRFSSKEQHPYCALYYYGFRFYDPQLQRWLNRDPIGEAGGINLYGFVANSPVSFVDLLGLKFGNPVPPCAPYPECLRPKPPPRDEGPWDDGYTDCWIDCMLGLPTAVHVAAEAGGAKKAAGAYYHFKDRRFTAWGRESNVLVPRAKVKIGAFALLVSACEAWICADKCWKLTDLADPEIPEVIPPPYLPEWPGRGRNAPPIVVF